MQQLYHEAPWYSANRYLSQVAAIVHSILLCLAVFQVLDIPALTSVPFYPASLLSISLGP